MTKRKAISKKTRFDLFKRDRFTCQYCGKTPPTVVLVLDHIVPVVEGGETTPENLTTACEDCNQGKGPRPLDDIPEPLAEALEKQVAQREQLEEFNKFLMRSRKRERREALKVARYWREQGEAATGREVQKLSERQLVSLRVFLERLPTVEVYDAVDIAHTKNRNQANRWLYFCGVCWSKVRAREGVSA